MFIRLQISNPSKHPAMPAAYPWEIVISDTQPIGEGWTAATQGFIDALRVTLSEEFAVYQAAVALEQQALLQRENAITEIKARIEFFNDLVVSFSFENVLMGVTLVESQALLQKLGAIISAGRTGALETALVGWMGLAPDRLLTELRITSYGQQIASRVGIALPERY